MSRYKHVFFDLDRTLWDMDANSYLTLCELADKHKITERGILSADEFISKYKVINDRLWFDYSRDLVDRETLRSQRFKLAFKEFGIEDDQLSDAFASDYVSQGPLKNKLMPDTIDVLEYLHEKYQLHIITNGFEEVQHLKIINSNLEKYFSRVITSDLAGFKKPHPGIFEFSFRESGAAPDESIMIGDSLDADIAGAKKCGMAQVYFNPEKIPHNEEVTHEICSLIELKKIL